LGSDTAVGAQDTVAMGRTTMTTFVLVHGA
jgi:hypothetical protein